MNSLGLICHEHICCVMSLKLQFMLWVFNVYNFNFNVFAIGTDSFLHTIKDIQVFT